MFHPSDEFNFFGLTKRKRAPKPLLGRQKSRQAPQLSVCMQTLVTSGAGVVCHIIWQRSRDTWLDNRIAWKMVKPYKSRKSLICRLDDSTTDCKHDSEFRYKVRLKPNYKKQVNDQKSYNLWFVINNKKSVESTVFVFWLIRYSFLSYRLGLCTIKYKSLIGCHGFTCIIAFRILSLTRLL